MVLALSSHSTQISSSLLSNTTSLCSGASQPCSRSITGREVTFCSSTADIEASYISRIPVWRNGRVFRQRKPGFTLVDDLFFASCVGHIGCWRNINSWEREEKGCSYISNLFCKILLSLVFFSSNLFDAGWIRGSWVEEFSATSCTHTYDVTPRCMAP